MTPAAILAVCSTAVSAALLAHHAVRGLTIAPRRCAGIPSVGLGRWSSALRPRRIGSAPGSGRTRRHRPVGTAPHVDPALLAAWLDTVAAATRTGASLRGAIVDTASPDLEDALGALRRPLERGARLEHALQRWRADREDPSSALAAATLLTIDDVGGSAAPPLERTAARLRQRVADCDERRSWAAQAQLSAIVMTALPLAVLAFLLAVDDGVRRVVTTPFGSLLVAVGVGLDAIGWWWMRRVVRGATA